MYRKLDYFRRGIRFVNNQVFPSEKKLSSLFFYTTTLCDSQCKHCLIWKKRPVETMPKDKIVEIMHSKCITKDTLIGLEGGEFLLHPEAMELLKWFKENHPHFDLLSNCLKPDKLIEAVKKYTPHRLYVSLDGNKETYHYMRGRDGFDQVIRVVEACKDIVPLSLMFTISPYNSFEDMEYVVEIARKYGVDIRIGVYNNINFFDTTEKAHDSFFINAFRNEIPDNVKITAENYDFLVLYDEWRKGDLKLKCYSIKDSLVVLPNGDIPMCQHLDIKLGNLYERPLDQIFNSRETITKHKHYVNNCNGCWVNFHRKYDIVLIRSAERFFPKKMIELYYGKYSWSGNRNATYNSLFDR